MPCLSDDMALAFVEGRLAPADRPPVEKHLDGCADCRLVVAELAGLTFAPEGRRPSPPPEPVPGTPAPLAQGTQVGRHVITRVLGAGASGIVYEAFDPELARKVSLKLLRPVADGATEGAVEAARAQLLREAQAMARLSHPNVVTVYDVGTYEGSIVMVREYVEGESLAEWLRRGGRTWKEILSVFLAAGRGLAAAHAAGLVHQDFKPDNVLVGADGSVRVTDFGLAFPVAKDVARARNATAGTPAFMAPEQAQKRLPDARTDQFSFCVALSWALHGRHPFHATRRARAGSPPRITPGQLPPATDKVPPWLDQIVKRGLRLDPRERFDTVDRLLDALARPAGLGPPARPRPWGRLMLGAAGGLIAITAGVVADRMATKTPAPASARSGAAPVAYVGGTIETCDEQRPNEAKKTEKGPCLSFHDQPRAWAEAGAVCAEEGAHLATCTSSRECDRLAAGLPAGRAVWIGLAFDRDRGGGISPTWVTGEAFEAHFADGRLDMTAPEGDTRTCVALAPEPGDPRRWLRSACDQRYAFACERPRWRVSRRTRHAYRMHPAPLPWAEARRACERLGAHLATVTDAFEHTFIEASQWGRGTALDLNLWIGATDVEQQGRFRWITGEPFAFQAFHPNEPDNRDGAQDCLIMNGATRRWHDRHCGVRYPALCEREP